MWDSEKPAKKTVEEVQKLRSQEIEARRRKYERIEGTGGPKGVDQVQAEQPRLEGEQLYRMIFDGSPCAIFITVEDAGFVEANEAASVLTGYSREELKRMTIPDLHEQEDTQAYKRFFHRIIAGEQVTSEGKILRKDGTKVDTEFSNRRIMIGDVAYMHTVARDITERKRTERAVRDNEERFKAIFDNATDGILLAESESKKFFLGNEAICQMLGYGPEEIRNLQVSDIHSGKDVANAVEQFEQQLKCEITLARDIPVRRKDGSIFYADVNASPVMFAGKTYLLGIFRDTTERKKAAETIRQSNEFLTNVLESLGHPFYVIDANDYTIKLANKACNFGSLSEESTCFALTHNRNAPCSGEQHPCTVNEIKKTRKPVAVEHVHYDKDGNAQNVEFHAHPILDDDGDVVQVIEYVLDVTQRDIMTSEQEATIKLLGLINATNHLHGLIKAVTVYLRDWSGCEAVGVRLRDGEDFPYFETRGFDDGFVLAESKLCTMDERGQLVCDDDGKPCLECMCGNVISGRFDPAKPFFTEHGSFWTNSTTELLAGTTETDRMARTRNRCNTAGYESVALVPLRMAEGAIGLLQFNDKREGCFTPGKLLLLERLADNLAIGLAQRQAQMALRESEERYKSLFENMQNGFALHEMVFDEAGTPIDYIFLDVNEAFEKQTNLEREDLIGRKITEALPGIENDPADWISTYGEVVLTGNSISFENYSEVLRKWYSVVAYRPNEGQFAVIFLDTTERKRAEVELSKSESRFRELVENIHEVFWMENADGTELLYVNPAYEQVWGRSSEELKKNTKIWIDCIHPDDRKYVEDAFAKGRLDGTYSEEYRIIRPDGSMRWIWDRNFVIRNEFGDIQSIAGVAEDITERKKAQDGLRDSEHKYRTLVEANPYGIQEIDTSGTITYANPAYQNMLGYTEQELLGKLVLDLLEPESRRDELHDYLSILVKEQPEPTTYHQKNRTKDDRVIDMEVDWNYSRDNEGRVVGFRSVITDVTDRKRAEEELQALVKSTVGTTGQDCFDKTVEILCEWLKADCAIIGEITDESTVRVVSMQLDGEMIHDYTYSLEGTPCADVVEKGCCTYPEGVSTLFPDDDDLVKLKAEGYVGTPLRDKDGTIIGVLCAISRRKLRLPKEAVDVMSIIAARIASEIERGRVERQAQKHQSELIHVSRLSTIGQMASELAHELNQPLCATMMHLESSLRMVKSDVSNMDKIGKKLEAAVGQIDRAGKTVSRVKGFAMKGKGKRTTVFVNDTIREATAFMETELRHKRIFAELDLDEKIQPVLADPIQIEQVVLNLIQNASDAMQDVPEEQRKLTISTRVFADTVEVAVKDTGEGIDKDNVANVFDSFATTKSEGLGVGLSISQSIVESHGGRIYYRENPDHGVTFYFTLPLRVRSRA